MSDRGRAGGRHFHHRRFLHSVNAAGEVRLRKPLGVTMRKIALLLAAALVVSAPLIAATPSLTYAAAKAKAKAPAAKQAPAAKRGAPASAPDNSAFMRALGDLFDSFGRPAAPKKAKKKA